MKGVTEMICINCPLGCRMRVEERDGEIVVTGNTCERGRKYAVTEMTAPRRTVTSSVSVSGGVLKTVSLKTNRPILKSEIFSALSKLKGVTVKAPIKIGDTVVKDIASGGESFVATRTVEKEKSGGKSGR